jgi:hypothetical protein
MPYTRQVGGGDVDDLNKIVEAFDDEEIFDVQTQLLTLNATELIHKFMIYCIREWTTPMKICEPILDKHGFDLDKSGYGQFADVKYAYQTYARELLKVIDAMPIQMTLKKFIESADKLHTAYTAVKTAAERVLNQNDTRSWNDIDTRSAVKTAAERVLNQNDTRSWEDFHTLTQNDTGAGADKFRGGRVCVGRKNAWQATKRTVRRKDGSARTLYSNPTKPGDLRIRKMVQRNGRTVATYVKP